MQNLGTLWQKGPFPTNIVRLYTSGKTRDHIRHMLNWDVLPHPAYNTDLVPYDYYFFHSLKNFFHAMRLEFLDELQNTFRQYFT